MFWHVFVLVSRTIWDRRFSQIQEWRSGLSQQHHACLQQLHQLFFKKIMQLSLNYSPPLPSHFGAAVANTRAIAELELMHKTSASTPREHAALCKRRPFCSFHWVQTRQTRQTRPIDYSLLILFCHLFPHVKLTLWKVLCLNLGLPCSLLWSNYAARNQIRLKR